MTTKTTNNNKFRYVFSLKSTQDLTGINRLIEVLELKPGEYIFNGLRNSIEVVKDAQWEEFLNNKIKQLGFEKLLQGKSYNTSNETDIASLSDTYTDPDSINKLHNRIYQTYGKGNKIIITNTQIDHNNSNVVSKFTITPSNPANKIDYAVALSIYNRQYSLIDSNGMPIISFDDLINSIPDEEIVKGLNVLKSIIFK